MAKRNVDNTSTLEVFDPLAWFAVQTDQRRFLANQLETLATELDFNESVTGDILAWLKVGLPLYLDMEQTDFFPLLRIRAQKRDDFNGALSQLADLHGSLQNAARRILPQLEGLALKGHPATMDAFVCKDLLGLAKDLRRHSAILSAIILPFARLRLRSPDLESLARFIISRKTM